MRFGQVFRLKAQILGDFVRFEKVFLLRAQIFSDFLR